MDKRVLRGALICGSLLALAALSGCGSSSDEDSVPTSQALFNSHSVGFKGAGNLATWGYNGFGQLGNKTLTSTEVPQTVLTGILGFAAGADHTLAFNSDGVWAWGSNYSGQLGQTPSGVGRNNDVPLEVGDFTGVTSVAAGAYHSLVAANGEVSSWGDNSYGQLGNDSKVASSVPVKVVVDTAGTALGSVEQVAAGAYHSLALTDSVNGSTVYAWGRSTDGRVGQPVTDASTVPPTDNSVVLFAKVVNLDGPVTKIAAGGSTSAALRNDGTVWVWGSNNAGQLGKDPLAADSPLSSHVPLQITLPDGALGTFTDIAVGLNHLLAIVDDGSGNTTVWAWGFNQYGQLGNGDRDVTRIGDMFASFKPVQVFTGTIGTPLTGVTQIYAFGNTSLARTAAGLYAWGDNAFGQCGVAVDKNTGILELAKPISGM